MRKIIYAMIFAVILLSVSFATLGEVEAELIPIKPKVYTLKVVHDIKFDKTSYGTFDTAKLTITDSTLNANSKQLDTVTVYVYSKLKPEQQKFTVNETDLSTGVFVANVKISSITTSDDTLTAHYNYVSEGKEYKSSTAATVTAPVTKIAIDPIIPRTVVPNIPPPTISLDKTSYTTSETTQVKISHQADNKDANKIETVNFVLSSKTNPTGLSLWAKETGINTGIFTYSAKVNSVTNTADTLIASLTGTYSNIQATATVTVPMVVAIPRTTLEPKVAIPYIPPPTIILDKVSYLTTDSIQITISHQAANTDSNKKETVNFVIFSKANPKQQSFWAMETGTNTAKFQFQTPVEEITATSDTITVALTGDYSNIKITADTTQPIKLAPIDSVKKLETATVDQNKIQTALDDLYVRKVEETSVKTTTELAQIIQVKEDLLVSKQNILTTKMAAGINPLLLLKEREDSVRATIDYLSQKGEYVKRGQATQQETTKYNNDLKDLAKERKALSYDSLTKKFEKKIDVKRTKSLDAAVKPKKLVVQRLDTKIYNLKEAVNPLEYAQKVGLELKNNRVKVLVDLSSIPPSARDKILSLGGQIEAESQKQVQLNIPVDQLEELIKIPSLKQVRPPTNIMQHAMISEGVSFINADVVQSGGYTGNGIDVAILDLAFNTQNSEISSNIAETKSFRSSFGSSYPMIGYNDEHIHGTAVAEIVVDVAPDVDLYLYAMGTELEFQEAIDWAISQDVDIIAMSAGWVNYPTDGQSAMTKKLEDAIDSGITTVISAGNYAETHWEGKFTDGDSNGWHEFSGGDEGISIEVTEGRFNPITLYLLWDSSFDFDLVLIGPDNTIVDISENIQQNANDLSLESINYMPDQTGFYEIGISFAGNGKPNSNLEIFSPSDRLEYSTASGSVGVPTDAQGIITVGAIHHADASLEPFSSQGPTNHGKSVPNVMGPDAVSTKEYGDYPFYGTSAAAPYVSGVAALILEQSPNLSPSQVIAEIQSNADKNAVLLQTNSDNIFGYGKLDAEFIITEAGQNLGIDTSQIEQLDDEQASSTTLGPDDYDDLQDIPVQQQSAVTQVKIPTWIKEQTKWWIIKSISDTEFVSSIQYLIKNDIIVIPQLPESGQGAEQQIPDWVVQNAQWWVDGNISDTEFAKGLEFLIKVGIIRIN